MQEPRAASGPFSTAINVRPSAGCFSMYTVECTPVWVRSKNMYRYRREGTVVINRADFFPRKAEAVMKTTAELLAAVLRNTVGMGCLCALYIQYTDTIYCTVHIVHHSADRALSLLFRLSRANVGFVKSDIQVSSLLLYDETCFLTDFLLPKLQAPLLCCTRFYKVHFMLNISSVAR